jgi:nicotinate phosphoribosyltransferase
MDTSADAPYLDCAYKLVEYGGKARRKRSEGKVLWPGRKQVFRSYDSEGRIAGDVLGLEDETWNGEALIQRVMKDGRRVAPPMPLKELRERTLSQLKRLPNRLRSLKRAGDYSVIVSDAIQDLARHVDLAQAQAGESDVPKKQASAEEPLVS